MCKENKKPVSHDENQEWSWGLAILSILFVVLAVIGFYHCLIWIEDLITPLFTDFHSVVCH